MKEIPSVEEMYQHFLLKVGLNPLEISKEEDKERRITFYAGVSTVLRIIVDDISGMPEGKGVEEIVKFLNECRDFWRPFLKD